LASPQLRMGAFFIEFLGKKFLSIVGGCFNQAISADVSLLWIQKKIDSKRGFLSVQVEMDLEVVINQTCLQLI
jgi:hypothetical protein